ncbi:50S ribosomal protein L31e [archaeon]|nr:50S ribosomal protein L31e [archaeon]|tara:strand:- start:1046 stop:1444 length:399 start_codon:yes stop_codon:yes gene_type:complete
MADAKKMERSYTIPLRREFLKVPRYKRAKKATAAIKQFLTKHMKSDKIKVGTSINEKVWENGMRNPPSKVRVQVVKDEEGTVTAELFGAKKTEVKKVNKKAPVKKKEAQKPAPAKEKKTEDKPVEAAPAKSE